MAVVTQIQVRRGTASQWTATNPVLAAGEWGYESDTNKAKIGNGSSAWNSLSYFGGTGTVSSITAGTGLSGGTITSTGTIAIDTATTVDVSTAQTLTNKTLTGVIYTQTLLTPSFTTNAYTLALGDQGDILLASNGATAGTINIPTNGSVGFPIGTQITIIQTGAGQLTIQASSSGTTTVNSTGATATAPKLRAQNSSATCIKTGTDTWYVLGDIS
jgi:hypothetical protein